MKEHIYKVGGMHCASCEILIEKKLLDIPNIKSVNASTSKGEVIIEYESDRPNPDKLSKLFEEENYKFSDFNSPSLRSKEIDSTSKKANPTLVSFNIAIFIVIIFLILDKMGVASILSLNSASSLFAFFGFGLLAGISSCAALIGGIILSLSKQWNILYAQDTKISKKLQPHLMFNFGRILSYIFFGAILGGIGSKLQISPQFTAYLIIAISFLMIAFGLQMLGVKALQKFQISTPKSATRYIANENNFRAKYAPFIMGALTFFLPCGFTITAQGIALVSGSPVYGALIMGAFALGTVPVLLSIGISSVKFSSKPHSAERFSKVAGFLLLFFALFNMSNQMNILGFTGIELNQPKTVVDQKDLPPIVNGKQILKMNASSRGYSPNYLKVKMGIPVVWEITDTGTSGCTNAIIARGLFDGEIRLTPGQTSKKEFTPQKTGKYKFSCWMGMVSGTIEVVK